MKRDEPEQTERDDGFALADPVMDAALTWFTAIQGYPDDARLKADVEAWKAADPRNAAAYAAVSGVWDFEELNVIAADVGQLKDKAQITEPAQIVPFERPKRSRWAISAMAAAAVIFIGIGIRQYPGLMLQLHSDYQTAAGGRQDITLPDGSKMTLNTASAVSLDFENGKRSVKLLQGEAYFDVVHDETRPFKVAAGYSEVVVKGTAFAVRSDTDKDVVVLERGLVGVSRLADEHDTAELHPGETITASASALSTVHQANPSDVLSWRDGRLIFENEPFAQVLAEIGRYYPHAIIVGSDRVGKARVTGNYKLDNPERVIRSLAATVGGDVTRIPGGMIILR